MWRRGGDGRDGADRGGAAAGCREIAENQETYDDDTGEDTGEDHSEPETATPPGTADVATVREVCGRRAGADEFAVAGPAVTGFAVTGLAFATECGTRDSAGTLAEMSPGTGIDVGRGCREAFSGRRSVDTGARNVAAGSFVGASAGGGYTEAPPGRERISLGPGGLGHPVR